ncbi:hypothetical protein [Actinomyces sp. ICM47]|uniref:hypothetical protein n=1 Tax=Actinomyces sp. ICM47 TaxID=936548 RepID=UPI0025BBAA10|nr:hypothetical protein [Actinomyces sp. ICM47]
MSKISVAFRLAVIAVTWALSAWLVYPFWFSQRVDLLRSPSQYNDSITFIVNDPTRLREIRVRISLDDSCVDEESVTGKPCDRVDREFYGSLQVGASIYGDVPGVVREDEINQLGLFVYAESDALNELFSGKCSNLTRIESEGDVDAVLEGTAYLGRGGSLYSLSPQIVNAVEPSGPSVTITDTTVQNCPYGGGFFSVNAERIEALTPHVNYVFKKSADANERHQIINNSVSKSNVPLRDLVNECVWQQDHYGDSDAVATKGEGLDSVRVTSQICPAMSMRYRTMSVYADSVKDDRFNFDRGLQFKNYADVPIVSGASSSQSHGLIDPVYIQYEDQMYKVNESRALFAASIFGPFAFGLIFELLFRIVDSCTSLKVDGLSSVASKQLGHLKSGISKAKKKRR